MNISTGKYKKEKSIVMENDTLKAMVLPYWGSKIVSIIYKPKNIELLWQNPGTDYKRTRYGDLFESGEFSGFDEMFPTISRCMYEGFPWEGIELPDHGEVWSIPWMYEIAEESVSLWVYGVRFPYRLEKIVLLEEDCIYLKYRAVNLSSFPLDFIWAAHTLFNTSEEMELIVPQGMGHIINSVSGPRLKKYGEILDFPDTLLEDGNTFHLGRMPARNDFGYQKYYFSEKMTEGWCILYDRKKSLNIGMCFPKEKVSYLGVWVNEGGWEGQYNMAPEPATGAMDRVDFAKMWGMNSVLPPHGRYEWHLYISVKAGKKAGGMKENGEFVC